MTGTSARDQVRVWVAHQHHPDLDQLRAEVEAMLADVSQVDKALADLHVALARRPERKGDVQGLVDDLVTDRCDAAVRLGQAVVASLRAGADLDLQRPEDANQKATVAVPMRGAMAHGRDLAAMSTTQVEPSTVASSAASSPDKVSSERLALVGPSRDLTDTLGLLDEVEALEGLCGPATMARWPLLPKVAQRALLGMAVARTRSVKDRPNLSPGIRERLKIVIATFPAYAKRYAPGYVNGLQLNHDPKGISWRADGLAHWDELRRLERSGRG